MSRDHHVICVYGGFQLNMRYCEELEAFIESLSPEEQLRARALYPKPTYLTKPLVDKKEKEKESKERSRARKRSKVKQLNELIKRVFFFKFESFVCTCSCRIVLDIATVIRLGQLKYS